MALEDLVGPDKFIANLVNSNPTGTDVKAEGDDHIRGVKNTLVNTFPQTAAAIVDAVTAAQIQLAARDLLMKNAQRLSARNFADDADVSLLDFNVADLITLGAAGASGLQGSTVQGKGDILINDVNFFSLFIDGSGNPVNIPPGWSSTSPSTGRFTVTHNLGLTLGTDITITATVFSAATFNRIVTVTAQNINSFNYQVVDVLEGLRAEAVFCMVHRFNF